jgi:hypothetical protein
MRRPLRAAFTLIELMTIIAITGILLALIIIPLVQSFNITKIADAFSDAQDRARGIGERIGKEISDSAGVRDNGGINGGLLLDPVHSGVSLPASGLTAGGESLSASFVPYLKLDILPASQGDQTRDPVSGAFINPLTGKADPTIKSPKGQPNLPFAFGGTIVRYWISLKDPFKPYSNPYNNVLGVSNNPENLYVLRRAEVAPFVFQGGVRKVNTKFFYDLSTTSLTPAQAAPTLFRVTPPQYRAQLPGAGPMYNDPAFCDPFDITYSDIVGGTFAQAVDRKQQLVKNWVLNSQIVSNSTHGDMIQPVFDRNTHQAIFDGQAPRLYPLVQFKPGRITNEAAEGQTAVRPGEESDDAASLAPDVYRTQYPLWSNQLVRIYPDAWDPNTPAKDWYLVGRRDALQNMGEYLYSPSVDGLNAELTSNRLLFDISGYIRNVNGTYPFSAAVNAANALSGWQTSAQAATNFAYFAPWFYDAASGKIFASFGINEVGAAGVPPPANDLRNLPIASVAQSLAPAADTGVGATFSPLDTSAPFDINRCFNKQWSSPDGILLQPNLQRFIYLPVTAQGDGTPSPLPLNLDPADPNRVFHYDRATIVPGSEQVTGPDQLPGPHFGLPILYTRTTREPGPNQYRINYVNQGDPADPAKYAALGLPAPPAVYDPTDFVSAIIQPRYSVGYIQLNSDPNDPLPVGDFFVYFRFQFTKKQDLVAVDYDTRSLMNIIMSIKNFPQQGLNASQNVTIPVTAKIRSYQR